MKPLLLCFACVAAAGNIAAQPHDPRLIIDFEGSSIVSPTSPAVTARVWAAWDPDPHGLPSVFLSAGFDLRSSERGFENPVVVLSPTMSTWGNAHPLGYTGAGFGQIHLPPKPIGKPDNPILLGTIDWRATSFDPRTVDLWTENEHTFKIDPVRFPIAPIGSARATITIVPAPAGLWLLCLATIPMGRRR
jgi:hypothetical protein